ncbi:MAG TPA: PaaI family thioesterase [Marmoricola sp.]|nr:PaaI family thioesterase [Marmoricola sp.]HNJ79382.1 PaaI family thioesterase [Marmoricola sp.]
MKPQQTAPFPLATHLGMVTEVIDEGGARARVEVTPEHLNPHGAVHGAVLFALVDTAMGAATLSVLASDQWCASIEVQLRFVRPVFSGQLMARARVISAGKRIVHLSAEVRDDDDELVALATGSFAVIPKPA